MMASTKRPSLIQMFLVTGTLCLTLTGCEFIENLGGTDTGTGTPTTTPADFTVTSDPVNPPPVIDDGDETTQPPETPVEEGFLINGGALKTKDAMLELQFITLSRYELKISTQNCTNGVWEAWSQFRQIPVPLQNQMLNISVQYKDWDGNISRCYRQSILHDAKGPDILFTKYPPATLEEGATTELSATITDALTSVKSVTCSMNGIQKACFAGVNDINVTALPLGDYVFKIDAEDEMGNKSTQSVSWKVVNSARKLTQDIRVNNYKKVDILIVIDNSPSMKYEQQNMGARTSNLLAVLRGLDYQIAVTTTDIRNIALGGGRFIPISGMSGRYIIDSTMNESTAQQRLSATLQRSELGDSKEQGIYVTRQVINRFDANEANARAFFREGAQFAVLTISDEDESGQTEWNDPQKLVDAVHASFQGQKMFSFHSIITKPNDVACRDGEGATYGNRYKVMSDLTGGVIGSVCAQDYASQVTGIAQGIRDLLKTMTLQCAPLAGKAIIIRKDGVIVRPVYQVVGVNLQFATELEPGNYHIDYECLRQ